MNRIINAVHSTVPEELWPEILRKIDGPGPADISTDEFDECEVPEDFYDTESAEAGEDCWTATARRDSPVEVRRAAARTVEAPSPPVREFTPRTGAVRFTVDPTLALVSCRSG